MTAKTQTTKKGNGEAKPVSTAEGQIAAALTRRQRSKAQSQITGDSTTESYAEYMKEVASCFTKGYAGVLHALEIAIQRFMDAHYNDNDCKCHLETWIRETGAIHGIKLDTIVAYVEEHWDVVYKDNKLTVISRTAKPNTDPTARFPWKKAKSTSNTLKSIDDVIKGLETAAANKGGKYDPDAQQQAAALLQVYTKCGHTKYIEQPEAA